MDLAAKSEVAYRDMMMPFWRAQARRRQLRFGVNYIGIIGSCGKSTATLVTAALLDAQRPTAMGPFYNTEKFAMRFMRRLNRPVDFFVQELSEYPVGGLAAVATSMHPVAVAATAIGLDHLTAFKNTEAIRLELAEMIRLLAPNAIACLNADDPEVRRLAEVAPCRVILYGRTAEAELRVENLRPHFPERLNFDLVIGGTRRHVQTRFAGTLLLPSILAGLALAYGLGLDMDRAVADLAKVEPHRKRMAITPGDFGHSYMFDTYKAPFWSTKLLAADIPNMSSGRRILVLGEVSDTASDSSRRYRQIFRLAASGADLVIGIDEAAGAVDKLKRNEPDLPVVPARNKAELRQILKTQPPSLVIMKGNEMKLTPQDFSLEAQGQADAAGAVAG